MLDTETTAMGNNNEFNYYTLKMQCTNPYFVETLETLRTPERGFFVPCGKCVACKIRRSREWALRITHELSTTFDLKSSFLTLTYDDKHLPANKTLVKEHLQNFMKRLRKLFSPWPLKYYACGEYGETTARPHYHLIIFGISHTEFKEMSDDYEGKIGHLNFGLWPNGHFSVGTVTYDSSRYVAQYIDKKYNGELAQKVYNDTFRIKPFQLCSQGLGYDFAMQNSKWIREDLFLYDRGKKVGVPRYYQQILSLPREVYRERSIEKTKEVLENLAKKGLTDPVKADEHIWKAKAQRDSTLRTRGVMKFRKKL